MPFDAVHVLLGLSLSGYNEAAHACSQSVLRVCVL